MSKQYLVVKVAQHIGEALSVVPLPGIFSLSAAEELVREITAADPGLQLLIQEVGAA